jgi:hypothetical protein
MKTMNKGEEAYEFIGKLAVGLYTQGIKLRLSTLQKILNDKGADYGGGIGMGKVISAAYEHWKKKDWVIHHAIAASFTGQNDQYLFD